MPLTVLVVCASDAEAAAVAARLHKARRRHFGLFHGYEGQLGSGRVLVAVSGPGEDPCYAAVRQMVHLYSPAVAFNFGVAATVSELLHRGDVVLARTVRRTWCPPAIVDEMLSDDAVAFRSDAVRERILPAPRLDTDTHSLDTAVSALTPHMPPRTVQWEPQPVAMGCMEQPLARWRGREYVRARFEVECVDTDSYGFTRAATDSTTPYVIIKVVGDDCSDDALETCGRRAGILPIGAKAVETVLMAMIASQRAPVT